jgi:UDP-glucose:(heptosyl)LPS alpha-1,3-glucosyltransferase
LKIALVIDRFDPRRGGGEGYVVTLARALAKRGHQVHVFTQGWVGGEEGIAFHRLSIVSYPRWTKILSLALSAHWAIRTDHFDVVQGFGGAPYVDVHRPGGGVELAWLIQEIRSRERGLDRILTTTRRVLSLKLVVNLILERAVYGLKASSKVVANSAMVKEDIIRFYRSTEPSRIRIIRNGVDTERFHPRNRLHTGREFRASLGLAERTAVLLFMAHNFRLKGLHCLIGSLRGAKRKVAWVLLVAGRGRRGPFQDLAKRCGMDDRLMFIDHVKAPETVLAACDILVHPTFYDPFSNVCLEAMASGVPVVTTRHNGASEIIQNGLSGFVISDPRRGDVLLEAIEALLDPLERMRMGEEARRVAEHFSWDQHLSEVESVYRQILEERT